MNQKQIERAAVKLCELRGEDPEELISHGMPGSLMAYRSPRNVLVAGEIQNADWIQSAIAFAKENDDV